MKQRLRLVVLTSLFWGELLGLFQARRFLSPLLKDLSAFSSLLLLPISFLIIYSVVFLALVLVVFILVFELVYKPKWSQSTWLALASGLAFGVSRGFALLRNFPWVKDRSFGEWTVIFVYLFLPVVIVGWGIRLLAKWLLGTRCGSLARGKQLGRALIFSIFSLVVIFLAWQVTRQTFIESPGLVLSSSQAGDNPKAQNLILVLVDALRVDAFNEKLMPNMTRFVQKGVTFSRAYSPAPRTFPTVSSYFTGRYFSELSEGELYLPSQTETLAEVLKDGGYLTQFIGANQLLVRARGVNQGFDGFINTYDLEPYYWEYGEERLVPEMIIPAPFQIIRDSYNFLLGFSSPEGTEIPDIGIIDAGYLLNQAIYWLEKRESSPFFLFIHLIDPHSAYDPPRRFSFDLSGMDTERLFDIQVPGLGQGPWSKADKELMRRLYHGEVAYVDYELAAFFHYLSDGQYFDNSVIIFTADHGEEFFEHGWVEHSRTLYQELVRVPFVVWLPGKEAQVFDQPISLINLRPTILSELGVRSWANEQSQDLLTGKASPSIYLADNKASFAENGCKAWVNWPYKYIWYPFLEREELYNLEKDPGETENLAKESSEISKQLKAQVDKQVEKIDQNRKLFLQRSLGERKRLPPIPMGY